MVENIRQELVNFQQTQGGQGTNIVISNENDLANLVAEKLYVKIKDDLIASGSGIISEVLISRVAIDQFFLFTKTQTFLGTNRINCNERQAGRTV